MTGNRTVLLVLDMQVDMCAPEGVFARHGANVAALQAIVPRITHVMERCRRASVPILACKLTVLTDLDGSAMGLGHLAKARPFLAQEGFRGGTPGHALLPALPPADYEFRKWTFSAMYQTELPKLLEALGAGTVVLTGVSTNGVVEGTARDAFMRDLAVITLSDCVAAFSQELHEASLRNLAAMGKVVTSEEFVRGLSLD